ncbi:hypothetical protein ABZ946_31155 [Streptomyces sp. NPDC046324]|uniref:hypothetical protein n=1 Tax=Streptomyces sp. NPDC046324 TaxID=3154915 RepID=UPI0033F1E26A
MKLQERGKASLSDAAAARRVEALFKAMAADFLLREQFVTDPAQILAEYVRGERLERRQAEDTNRLIHAVMSNPGLVRWIRDFARQLRRNRLEPGSGLADFGRAVIDNGAADVVTALVATSGEGTGVVGFDGSLLHVLADSSIFGVATATEVSGTHMSTGGSGTDPLTESSGTHVSLPAEADPLTEVSGTHMSTGGGGTDPLTESSGTHVSLAMSREEAGRTLGNGAGAVALEALMRYSVELRDRGLLDHPDGA